MTTSSTRPARAHLLWLLFPAVLILTGCGLLDNLPFEHLLMAEPDQTHLEEGKYREQFQSTQDPAAIRWLLAHRLENGMSRGQVEKVLGQAGRFEVNDRLFKSNSKAFQTGDKTYAFGPDSKGRAYYLMFRENNLVGFNGNNFLDEELTDDIEW